MRTAEAIQVLARHRGEAVVVCALGMAANEWWAATRAEDSFYMHGAMGFAASFALGLALAVPTAPVWALNADGSLCMNLGCLLTEAAQGAGNLHHFVVDNGVYQTVGAVPMVNRGRADYAALALAAGFRAAHTLDSAEALEAALPGILATPGPVLCVLRVEPESSFLGTPPMTYEGPEMKYRFGRALEARLGVTVFGPQGY
ncbi:thiamine pyrophosphate-dependent enzyme [Roseomonas sp. BN140053]|uniref:thiamine pyrophosphate-dependent enzyme n=1 Tax=Roseomonas sp. BN140053 TaxID=3391898 RepID=UPI0039EC83DC